MSEIRVNESLEQSPGGFIEAVKRTLVISLRRALTDSGLSLNDQRLHVDMEYPFEEASYPAAWVQFSFTDLIDSGLGHVQKVIVDDQEVDVRQWRYRGQVTITFMALSSLDRDRIADKFISVYAFSDVDYSGVTSNTPSTLLRELAESPYVSMTLQSGTLRPRGQSTSIGVPWDPGQLVYEDSYNFNLEGEFQQVYIPGEGYKLRRIEVVPTHTTQFTDTDLSRGGWV
jgi:hypothetical protein